MRSRQICILGLLLAGLCRPVCAGALNPIEFWNQELLQGIRNDLMSPTQSAYDIAIIDNAMFNAVDVASGLPLTTLGYAGPAVMGADAAAAAFQAGRQTALSLFTSVASQTTLGADAAAYGAMFGYNSPAPGSAIAVGEAVGNATAVALLARAATDGSQSVMAVDTGSLTPGLWRPTPPDHAPGVTPDWGAVTPFVLSSGSEFRAPPPPAIGSAAYNDALLQVQCMGGTTAPDTATCGAYAVTPAQQAANTDTALFWSNDANGTYKPPGQWIQATLGIATTLATPLSLLEDARLFALVATAMGDSAVAQWDTKYFYNVWRPVSAVNDPTNPNDDPVTMWYPALNTATSDQLLPDLHVTPAFPSYASGHSTFGAAVATVLADFFGTDHFTFTVASDSTTETRTFTSFSAAADESGLSRIYGGVHFSFDNTAALTMGDQVGAMVFADAFTVPEPGGYASLVLGTAALLAAGQGRRARRRAVNKA